MDKSSLIISIFIFAFFERLIYTLRLKEPDGIILDKLIGNLAIYSYIFIAFISFFEFLIVRNGSFYSIFIGLAVLICAIFLRRSSIKALGPFWSIYIRDIPNQKCIKSGPYKILKHPYYLSALLELLGIACICFSIFGFLSIFFIQMPLLFLRVLKENRLHKVKFSKEHT